MTLADLLLADLVKALDNAFISSWQSTAAWRKELDAAREHVNECKLHADAENKGGHRNVSD